MSAVYTVMYQLEHCDLPDDSMDFAKAEQLALFSKKEDAIKFALRSGKKMIGEDVYYCEKSLKVKSNTRPAFIGLDVFWVDYWLTAEEEPWEATQ